MSLWLEEGKDNVGGNPLLEVRKDSVIGSLSFPTILGANNIK